MYTISLLNAFTAPGYQSLTYPAYRELLQSTDPTRSVVAVGATYQSEKVGLAMGRVISQDLGEVLSLYVANKQRLHGLGAALLSYLEAVLGGLGCTRLQLTYPAGEPSTMVLERLLARRDWAPSEPRMLLCRVHTGIAHARWVQKDSLPKPYCIFPWAEITRLQAAAIQRKQEREYWIPENLVPFQHERDAEPMNSLAMSCHGEIVGWLLTHRLAPDTIRYTALFVRSDLQRLGLGLSLLAESIRRQVSVLGQDSFGSFGVPVDNTRMIRFVNKRLAPYLISRVETRGTFKLLGGKPDAN